MRRIWLPLVAVFLVGCPDIGRMTYRFDLVTGQGTLTLDDIGTDDPASAVTDFANLVNDYLLGSKVQDEHPSWRVGERRLYENGGRLDGVVVFTFDRASDVGLYQHTKKSEYLWCGKDGETVVSTSGEIVPPYPNCVVFHRKDKQFEVTVTTSDGLGTRSSLLPLYLAWNGEPVPVAGGSGGEMGNLMGDAFRSVFGATPAIPDAPNLSTFLPDVAVPEVWASLGLPLAGSKPVFSSERTYEASHPDTTPAQVVAQYEAVLKGAGYTAVNPGTDPSVWTRDGATVSVTATSAGSTVVVDLAISN